MHECIAFEVDALNRIRDWPDGMRELLGWDRAAALERSWVDLLAARDPAGNRLCPRSCGLHEMAQRKEPIGVFEILATRADGATLRLFVRVEPTPAARPKGLRLEAWSDRRQGSRERRGRLPLDAGAGDGAPPGHAQLTQRELEVLRLAARGHRAPEIARRLGLAPATVRNHAQHALEKLGASTRAEAIARALQHGLI